MARQCQYLFCYDDYDHYVTVDGKRHFFCGKHYDWYEKGLIEQCHRCSRYKSRRRGQCWVCNRKDTLIRDQQGRCNYCGDHYDDRELQLEHLIPLSEGGRDDRRNTQVACRVCNAIKHTATDTEFRRINSDLLPQRKRTPAHPPIDPTKLQGPGRQRLMRRRRARS